MPAFSGVRRDEWSAVAVAFLYFFALLSGYYVLRPIRDAMAVEAGVGRLGELFGWTFGSMLVLVPAWSWVVARFARGRVVLVAYEAFAVMLGMFAAVWAAGVARAALAEIFFVWLSVYNVFVVSTFWAFLADVFREDQARRLYGLVAAGGSAGAVAGPAVAALFAERVGIVPLLVIAAVLLQVCILCSLWLVRWSRSHASGPVGRRAAARIGGSPLAGFGLALRSPYLLGIAGLILLYALGSTLLYMEQTRIVKDALPDAAARVALFSKVDLGINVATVLIEIVGTGWVMTRLGLAAALVVLPALTGLGLAAYGLVPTLGVLIAAGASRRVAHFALEKPAREALFTVVGPEEKYKAKSFLDTVVYRGGDWLAGSGYTTITASISGPALALGFAPVALAGLPLAFFLARRQRALAAQETEHEPHPS